MTARLAGIALLAFLLLGHPLRAQAPPPMPAPVAAAGAAECAYARCALSIVPTWNGLLLVRGVEGERLGNLNFFWPHPIAGFVAGDSAQHAATRAFATRQRAALLTDAGGLLALAGAVVAVRRGGFAGAPAALTLTGGALLAASVPLQFAADGWMSRAVWWHNAGYSH